MIPYWRTVPPSVVKYIGKNASDVFAALAMQLEIIRIAMFPFGIMAFRSVLSFVELFFKHLDEYFMKFANLIINLAL